MKDHKLVPLRPPESILAVVRKAYGNATAYDVGHVWHEIYTRLPDAAPVQEQQPAPASKPVLLQCLGCERVGTQEQLSASTDCDCWKHSQPAPVQATSELKELRLAYAECSRQRNELLAKLKQQAQQPRKAVKLSDSEISTIAIDNPPNVHIYARAIEQAVLKANGIEP